MPKRRAGSRGGALSWPYWAAFALLGAVTYSAGVWWFAQSTIRLQQADAVARVELLADNLSSSIGTLLSGGDLDAVRHLMSEAGEQQQLDACRLTLADGRPLVDANLDKPQLTVMPASWPKDQSGAPDTRVVNGTIYVDRVVSVADKGQSTLSLTRSMPATAAFVQPMLPGAAMIGLAGLGGGALLFRKMQRRLAVLTLIRGALRDAGQATPDLGALSVNPEWGAEAEGWNSLLAIVKAKQDADTEQTLEQLNTNSGGGSLEAACEGLGYGLLLADTRGRLLYHNSIAGISPLLNESPTHGADLPELIADQSLRDLVTQVLSGSGPGRITHEITLDGGGDANTMRVTLRRLSDTGGLVITIEDITQQRIAEASRHDFVSQATHELRTPLTNIRLYVETAQTDGEDDKELRGECLNVISRESQRLERLVSEMLSVSEIEAGSLTIRRDDVRLDQLFKSLQQDYTANASKKSIELRFDLPPKLPAIRGDRDKLAIVVQNLL
ncbi:MAG: sensor histidine kinase, partial [Phycisphaeraceae bacterium]